MLRFFRSALGLDPCPEQSAAQAQAFHEVREFLRGGGKDRQGRTLRVVLGNADDWFKSNHGAFEWLFPVWEVDPSAPDAPVLTHRDLARLGKDERAGAGLAAAYRRVLNFLDVHQDRMGQLVLREADGRQAHPLAYPSRLTVDRLYRALASMTATGLQAEARALLHLLETHFTHIPGRPAAIERWRSAANR